MHINSNKTTEYFYGTALNHPNRSDAALR